MATLKLLNDRGYTKAVRDHLRSLIAIAKAGTGKALAADPKKEQARADYETGLRQLHAWHKDWSTTARAVLKRKDYLIRLGPAKRKPPTKKESSATGGAAGAGKAAPAKAGTA